MFWAAMFLARLLEAGSADMGEYGKVSWRAFRL